MEIPHYLFSEIKNGNVVLFLGSGASKGAKNTKGKEPPIGDELAKILYSRFIGDDYNNQPLSWVSDLAISESDIFTVQDYIRDVFEEFEPADFHLILPTFKWKALVTTNYDRIVEKSYNYIQGALQKIVPFVSNDDKVDELIKTKNDLPYIKLHGCITKTHDRNAPLILTIDQYASHEKGRSELFKIFKELGYEHSIIFIGHSLQDFDLRKILLQLSELGPARPRYYLICPDITEEEIRLWESRRISVLKGSYKEFLEILDNSIPKERRILQNVIDISHPIEAKFIEKREMSEECINMLNNDVEYIHADMKIEKGSPKKFYKGFDLGWYPIESDLDVRRKLTDVLLFDKILSPEEDRPTVVEFYVIKAEAGAGKSVFLKRLAWEAAIDGEMLCLYKRKYGEISYESIYEIYRLTNERIFLFIDN